MTLRRCPLVAAVAASALAVSACASTTSSSSHQPTQATHAGSPSAGLTPAQSPGNQSNTGGSSLATFFGSAFRSNAPFCLFKHQEVSIANGVLTANYPAGSSAPSSGGPPGGAQICEPFSSGSATDMTLNYEVRFPVGFQFVKGGKLPGMYGGVEPFSGGGHNPNGWSMRLMWRKNGAAEVYGYISTTKGYGNDWGKGNFSFQADGNWHQISEHIHLNTPGQSNGSVTLSYDGVQHIDQTGLAITTTNTPIGGVFFSTFFGGHSSSWAPSALMHIGFENFSLS